MRNVSQELEQWKNDFQVQSNRVVRVEQQLALAKVECVYQISEFPPDVYAASSVLQAYSEYSLRAGGVAGVQRRQCEGPLFFCSILPCF